MRKHRVWRQKKALCAFCLRTARSLFPQNMQRTLSAWICLRVMVSGERHLSLSDGDRYVAFVDDSAVWLFHARRGFSCGIWRAARQTCAAIRRYDKRTYQTAGVNAGQTSVLWVQAHHLARRWLVYCFSAYQNRAGAAHGMRSGTGGAALYPIVRLVETQCLEKRCLQRTA